MTITVYTPRKLKISESDLPALTAAARRRHKIAPDKDVPIRHIIEEARRSGLIELGKDYCLDLEASQTIRRNGTRKSQGKQDAKRVVKSKVYSTQHNTRIAG